MSRRETKTLTSHKSLSQNTSSAKQYSEVKKLPSIVEIRWVDAQTTGGAEWMDKSEMMSASKSKLPVMNSVGYLVHQDDLQYAIVSTLGPAESSQVHKIPKCMVLSVKEHG